MGKTESVYAILWRLVWSAVHDSQAILKFIECSTPRAIGSLILANVSSGVCAAPLGRLLGHPGGCCAASMVKRALCRGEHFFLFFWMGFVGGQTPLVLCDLHGHFLHVICKTERVSAISWYWTVFVGSQTPLVSADLASSGVARGKPNASSISRFARPGCTRRLQETCWGGLPGRLAGEPPKWSPLRWFKKVAKMVSNRTLS